MPEKTLSTHILNKHDVDTNWEDSSYVAKSGELIVYDVDSNNASPRLKIGDGNTVTDDLPFIAAGSIYSGTLPVGTDLNTLYGNQHWGKIYWLVDTHNISNTPNSVTSGSVEIIRAGYSSTIQIFRTSTASSSSSRPTSYQRRIDDQNPDSPTEWEEIVTAEGSYPSLMAGGVVATQGSVSDDLDNFKGSAYYGKSYYWVGGQNPSNTPPGANGGLLLVQRCGGVTTAQIFITHRSSNGTTPPVVYQRSQTSTDTWSDWGEIVNTSTNQTFTSRKTWTVTPCIIGKSLGMDVGTAPSSTQYMTTIRWLDKNEKYVGQVEGYQRSDNSRAVYFMTGNGDGTKWGDRLGIGVHEDGAISQYARLHQMIQTGM